MAKRRWPAVAAGAVAGVAAHDVLQKKRLILRNYPVVGHLRFALEGIRPMIQQYFIERDWDGRPYNRNTRVVIDERSGGTGDHRPFGTLEDVDRVGYEWFQHSITPVHLPSQPPRVVVGGPDCSQPYSMALMNVSAMSFGALSARAIEALNKGAKLGGFAHDTGEGGLSQYHLKHGGDLVFEVGTGYFSVRTPQGAFDPGKFADKAANDSVKMVSLKLSQGAKPGLGGVLPAAKVSEEIAEIRGVEAHTTCVSPPGHSVFSTPVELIEFIARMRELSGGKPAGFKLCVGARADVLAICKAILAVGTAPDFIIVDGGEGGTGAAPLEFEDNVGTPLTHGLMTVHNALVGTGLRDRIRIGASGKVAEANDLVKRLIQGADYTNSARSMMMAVGCIQALKCQTGKCPTGITTQDPRTQRAIDVDYRAGMVRDYQRATVGEAMSLMAAMGVDDPSELRPTMLERNVSVSQYRSYEELYDHLEPGVLLDDPPEGWDRDWARASADRFGPGVG